MIKKIYTKTENIFEQLTRWVTSILGNSITFIVALALVIFWVSNREFKVQNIHKSIGDIILGITFLSLFIIQKSFNLFSASLHLKVNELVSSHDNARNSVLNLNEKSEYEIRELAKAYIDLDLEEPNEAK